MPLSEELSAFVAQHPSGDLPASDAQWLLTLAGPGNVLDLADAHGRALVAVLLDSLVNAGHAAELVVLGRRGEVDAARVIGWALERTLAGPRRRLDLAGPETGPFPVEVLASHGFSESFRMHDLVREGGEVEPLPHGTTFIDIDHRLASVMHAVFGRAFANVPGAQIAALEPWTERVLSREPRMRVLFQGGRPVGFVRVRIEDGVGIIHALGREPEFQGTGIGSLLLVEGMRVLQSLGATRMKLEVAAQNARALALYERFAFRSVRSTSVWRRELA